MAEVWAFGRRPSSLVRFRHGGYSAVFPVHVWSPREEAQKTAVLSAVGASSAESVEQPAQEGHGDNSNVISFMTARAARLNRKATGRGSSRHGFGPKKPRE